jgi:hypothetical protein
LDVDLPEAEKKVPIPAWKNPVYLYLAAAVIFGSGVIFWQMRASEPAQPVSAPLAARPAPAPLPTAPARTAAPAPAPMRQPSRPPEAVQPELPMIDISVPTAQLKAPTRARRSLKKEIPSPKAAQGDPTQWRVSGSIFDILSLKPVEDAEISFINASSGERFRTTTGPDGSYRARLPATESYTVNVRHPDYEAKFLADTSPSIRKLSEGSRLAAVRQWMRTMQSSEPLRPTETESSSLKRDLALIPLQRPAD